MATITFEREHFSLFPEEDILQGLLRGGATVSYSCRKGTCHACMLRAVSGDPGAEAQEGLRPELRAQGYFLPCKSRPAGDLVIERADPTTIDLRMHVQAKQIVAPGIARLWLECETAFSWRPGQFVRVAHPSGVARSYSIASVEGEDPYVELHVAKIPGGLVSSWLVDEVAVGTVLTVRGPRGTCAGVPGGDAADLRPRLLLGTGTGLAPLWAMARAALLAGHRGPLELYHGTRSGARLYLHEELRALAERFPNFRYRGCVSRPEGALPAGSVAGRALTVARREHPDLGGWVVHLAGHPSAVHDARHVAFAAGAERADIHSDAFEFDSPFTPEDDRKLAAITADPDLWVALGEGAILRAILEDFYDRVYEDPRLEPFFHRVTKEHAIGKQYGFLADLITGRHDYFGLKPFNAHHWMVISDELFDYRERLLEGVMREHGLAEPHIRRWGALHERFRREIVKAAPRGLFVDGVELDHEKVTEETVAIASLCDGCAAEMAAGSVGRLRWRTGQFFCSSCTETRGSN